MPTTFEKAAIKEFVEERLDVDVKHVITHHALPGTAHITLDSEVGKYFTFCFEKKYKYMLSNFHKVLDIIISDLRQRQPQKTVSSLKTSIFFYMNQQRSLWLAIKASFEYDENRAQSFKS